LDGAIGPADFWALEAWAEAWANSVERSDGFTGVALDGVIGPAAFWVLVATMEAWTSMADNADPDGTVDELLAGSDFAGAAGAGAGGVTREGIATGSLT